MKGLLPILIFLASLATIKAQLWVVDPLEAIYPDLNDLTAYSNQWTGHYPIGTFADAHILIRLPKNERYTIKAELDGQLLDSSWMYQLIDVPVEENTGLDSRTEQFLNKVNPYVIRRAPFRIYEVIQPLTKREFLQRVEYSAFRLAIPTKKLDKKSKYTVHLTVQTKEKILKGSFNISIHEVELPGPDESTFFYTNWFNLLRMEESHQIERWSEKWFDILDKYAQMMAHGRQNSITLPGELIQYSGGNFTLNDSLMLRFIDVFRRHGFKYFEAPHLMNRGEKDDWGDPELKVALSKKRYYQENGKEDIEKLMKMVSQFVYRNKLSEGWLQHIADEPTAVNAQCYKDVVRQVKEIFPEARIMEATNDRDSLVGAIDIWCPLINDFQENEYFFRQREEQGEKVLIYTCLIPGGKWLNRTLDMERIRQVYFGWGAAHYQTGGYLHWGLNQYYADPFQQSVVKHPSPVAGPTNYLPAGDTHIIYPGKEGPLSSLRFEAHRMGIEDYDLLQGANRKTAKKLIRQLFHSYTDYSLDLKKYRKTKKKLLKHLD